VQGDETDLAKFELSAWSQDAETVATAADCAFFLGEDRGISPVPSCHWIWRRSHVNLPCYYAGFGHGRLIVSPQPKALMTERPLSAPA
jgi:hypothetical protein